MMHEAIQLLLIGAGITGAMMTALWGLHLRMKNAAVVDVGWASGIGILAVVYAVIGSGDPLHRLIAGIVGGVWRAFALFALGSPLGWLALVCPAMMLYFLLRVTGIPAAEEHALNSRGAAYAEYQRTTSAFVPWRRRAASH